MRILAMVAMVLALVSCTNQKSPTGRGQMLMYSQAEMRELGAQSFAQIKQQEKASTDRAINAYVRCVADAVTDPALLATIDPTQQETWEVVVFESDQVNAFALPGGHIGVYTGLLNVAKTPDQLATVLGHEVAHVLADHGNEQVSRAQMTNAGLEIVQIALGASGTENQDLIMAGLGLGAQVGIALPFGRQQESEADVVGLELMAKAGFDPAASVELWRNMARASGGAPPELLSTHPSHGTRIEDLQNLQSKAGQWYQQARAEGRAPGCRVPR
ncbi:M48 family metallopeptidase [Ferrimonas balearica]|uniref:M48 family metallopeptidase n=1 Tax=Ferrimonas balearica TaxID=44012 RepID=UPI001C5A326F|nr:M48 family metallopeptidase [Ferrimonas balearica]MBY6017584.1 M48 family metallopeptidase [Halomonas denitrificans]MBW3139915.1 M48 family metallopeptidase [Ferrimonas balearica]MBW3164939.1 M48 family metallopeptidase [Ferrimonas balearica]MBY6093923.1 M48 family metallopeptidase [Ferrimonas balearica]MBY6106977.1 M48 family metallopeptidase [Ferrimonas balearica]